ncbi:Flp family type IVb pilin [Methylobacterium sp. A49B]|nr:Flp family type IVb pilin [Methylobacterium mesophilicum]
MQEPGREPGCHGTGRAVARVGILSGGGATALIRFSRDARGATSIEYALIGALIFLVAAASLRTYASRVSGVYGQISTAVTQN